MPANNAVTGISPKASCVKSFKRVVPLRKLCSSIKSIQGSYGRQNSGLIGFLWFGASEREINEGG